MHYCGDDHLDADTVVLKARREKRQAKKAARQDAAENQAGGGRRGGKSASKNEINKLRARRDDIVARIEAAEARVGEINEIFCDPSYYERAAAKEVRTLESEQDELRARIDALTADWEEAEGAIAAVE